MRKETTEEEKREVGRGRKRRGRRRNRQGISKKGVKKIRERKEVSSYFHESQHFTAISHRHGAMRERMCVL